MRSDGGLTGYGGVFVLIKSDEYSVRGDFAEAADIAVEGRRQRGYDVETAMFALSVWACPGPRE